MSSPSPKHRIFASLADIAQAIGHASRLDILEHLAQGELSVEDLAMRTGLSIANTSRHLQILRKARLAEPRRAGKRMIYHLVGETDVIVLLSALGRIGERNSAEIQLVMANYFGKRDMLEPLTRAELLARIKADDVLLIDVRPDDEYAKGHIPTAINIPLSELEARMAGLPRNRLIVAYCRGPYCVFSVEAVAFLRAQGFEVRRLEDGLPEWRTAGLSVEP
ncbi:ArsR family transcriptional regulator, arsenate/arsenite/antimonite-responsive transcriptional repressor [Acidiphilium sp. MT5]